MTDDTNIALETYARCPICGRNDEAKKVSAILANQTQSMQGITIEKSSYQDADGSWHTSEEKVPFSGKQSSILAMKLKPPVQPIAQKPRNRWWRYIVLAIAIIYIGMTIDLLSGGVNSIFILWPIFLDGIFLWWFFWLDNKQKKEAAVYKLDVQKIQHEELPKWQKATERYRKLYYCFRDDCVFIPGEKTHAMLDAMNEYIYRIK